MKPVVAANLNLVNKINGEGLSRFHCSQGVLNALFESIKDLQSIEE